jgi:hypothetical protein
VRTRFGALCIVGIVLITASPGAQAPAPAAQGQRQGGQGQQVVRAGGNIRASNVPNGPTPRSADGKPDMTGVWLGGLGYGNIANGLLKGETLSLRPEAKKIMASRLAKDDPGTNCLPITPPRGTPYPWRMVVTPTHVFFLYEMYNYRQVFMNSTHPADPDPSWYGHSIGRWEGDTLVIDSIGFNDKGWFDSQGHPVSEKLHMVERYTRTNLGTMKMDVTIDDPGSYEKPFTVTSTARLMPGEELREYTCLENNQDVAHIEGPAATQGTAPVVGGQRAPAGGN